MDKRREEVKPCDYLNLKPIRERLFLYYKRYTGVRESSQVFLEIRNRKWGKQLEYARVASTI